MRTRIVNALSASVLAGLVLSACNPTGPLVKDTATITYDQVGACNGYQQNTGPGGAGPLHTANAGPKAAFLIFRVVSIDNSKSTIDFAFDPARLSVTGSSPKASMNSSLSLTQDLGKLTSVPVTIPKGQNRGINGFTVTVISTSAANGASEANNSSYFLAYDTVAGSPGVVLARRNSGQTTFPQTDNCLAVGF